MNSGIMLANGLCMKPTVEEQMILPLPPTMIWKSIRDMDAYYDQIVKLMHDIVVPSWTDFKKNIKCLYLLVAVETDIVLGFFIHWKWTDNNDEIQTMTKHYSCCVSIEETYIKPQMEVFQSLKMIS